MACWIRYIQRSKITIQRLRNWCTYCTLHARSTHCWSTIVWNNITLQTFSLSQWKLSVRIISRIYRLRPIFHQIFPLMMNSPKIIEKIILISLTLLHFRGGLILKIWILIAFWIGLSIFNKVRYSIRTQFRTVSILFLRTSNHSIMHLRWLISVY